MSLDLPHLASTPITERTAGDLTWAVAYKSPPLPPVTILGMPILQYPQPQLAQVSSGIISPSSTAPTSLLHAMAHLSAEPLPQPQPTHSTEECPMSGINQPRSMSTHSSLYQHSRNPSPAPQPSQLPRATTGRMSLSSIHNFDPDITEDIGNESTDSSGQSHNFHQSYSCPLSRDMSTSPTRQAVRAPSMSFPDPSHHSQTRLPSPMESQNPSHSPSHCTHQQAPELPPMTLPNAI